MKNNTNIQIQQTKKIFAPFLFGALLMGQSLYASTTQEEQILLENAWVNIGHSNAKDVMMSGATTATSKGYSSLFVNPAGLFSNYAWGVYAHTSNVEHKNPTGATNDSKELVTTQEVDFGDNMAVGIFYKHLVLEAKPDVHNAIGLAYGLETEYGLFSVGANYVIDETKVAKTTTTNEIDKYRTFATGDYYTAGVQWQKSFVGIDDFYALYLGFSQKGQGVNIVEGEQVVRVSPIVQRAGIGLETNLFSSTVLLTYDMSSQSWSHIEDKLDTQAVGLKWMPWSGLALGFGTSKSTYTTGVDLDSASTISAGVEMAIWRVNLAVAALKKEVLNKAGDIYMEDNNIHLDLSFAF